MEAKLGRRALALGLTIGLLCMGPVRANAAPDPVIAAALSAGSTLLPLSVSGILLLTGRGGAEGIRFDVGLVTLGVGAIVGPSVGQIYGGGGVDALVTFFLRAVTGSVLLVGTGFKLRGDEDQQDTGTALVLLGGIPTGLLALYDIYASAISARDARYEAGHAAIEVPADLLGIAACGPIPCLR